MLLLLLLPLLFWSTPQTTNTTPEEEVRFTVEQFVELNRQRDLRTDAARLLLTGEALTWGAPAVEIVTRTPDKIILIDDQTAVARMQTTGRFQREIDMYLYLKRGERWQVAAIRTLSQTGILEASLFDLKREEETLSADDRGEAINLELTLSSDRILKEWFANHRKDLDELCKKIQKERKTIIKRGDAPKLNAPLKQLHLSSFQLLPNGDIAIIVGGIGEDNVGYIYSPKKTPPKVSEHDFIWVEEIADKWYLYRTT